MEFEEMRKIWDVQNNEPMYVVNETAMHKNIMSKKNRINWLANVNELGMIIIAVATSTFLFFKTAGTGNVYAYLPAIALLLTGVYVTVLRLKRKNKVNQFDQSILGTIDHAISNADYLVNFSKTFFWWYILPIAIPVFVNMILKGDVPIWIWVFVPTSFIISFILVRWELNRCHLPRKKTLESLRDKLVQEVTSETTS
jgi:Ca2+/Na+ antiporter